MKMPLFFPIPTRVRSVAESTHAGTTLSLYDLCEQAQVPCKATGTWTMRNVTVHTPEKSGVAPSIVCEPGSQGSVVITTPANLNPKDASRYALAAMAYGLFDFVARESVRGCSWARPTLPAGRKRSGTAKSNSVRQREFQARKAKLATSNF